MAAPHPLVFPTTLQFSLPAPPRHRGLQVSAHTPPVGEASPIPFPGIIYWHYLCCSLKSPRVLTRSRLPAPRGQGGLLLRPHPPAARSAQVYSRCPLSTSLWSEARVAWVPSNRGPWGRAEAGTGSALSVLCTLRAARDAPRGPSWPASHPQADISSSGGHGRKSPRARR